MQKERGWSGHEKAENNLRKQFKKRKLEGRVINKGKMGGDGEG